MSTEDVLVSQDGALLRLRICRPRRRNALTLAMYDALTAGFERAAAAREVRVVVIEAEGEVFCAGNDLGDFVANPPVGEDSPVMRFLSAIASFPKPIVAVVGGPAVGVGVTMLLHCDLVYAAEMATFEMPFTRLGLVPEAGSSLLLPRLAGQARAAAWLLLGERFDAAAAREAGLVTALYPAEVLTELALRKANALAALPPEAVRQSKALLRAPYRDAVSEAMRAEGALFVARLSSPETAEAISAFFEKRAPDFTKL